MKKIFSEKEGKLVEVRNIKNVKFDSQPGVKFFVHRTLGNENRFSVSEESSGAAAVTNCFSVKEAIYHAAHRLQAVSPAQFKKLIDVAIEKQKEGMSPYV